MIARIGKYEIRAELGHDAFCRAFRAFDPDAARPVAILLLTEVADRQRLASFRADAAAAANIHHRNIVAIYELGEHVGLPFIAMQDLQGDDLRQVIANSTPLTLLRKMSLMSDLADGLMAAHRGGINHLGIRPAGVVLSEDGSARITEFGAVRSIRPTTNGSSRDDDALYAAPEQLTSSTPADWLSDIFVYGVIYYELLTGKHPFAAADPQAAKGRAVDEDPAPLRALAPDCPEALEQIVRRALQKDRELRYQSLDDAQCDAEPLLQQLKRERAATLLVESRRLLGDKELERAQAVVREVLELDPGNPDARQLRDAIRGRVQRNLIRSRLDALLRQAEQEAAARRFDEAVRTLESGLRLDGANAAIQSRLEEVRGLRERSQSASSLIAQARCLLVDEKLAEAHQSVSAALEADPQSREAGQLLDSIQKKIARREEELEFEEDLTKAKNLLLLESFEEAIEILVELENARPNSQQVEHWLEHARAQKSAKERQDRLHAGLNDVRRQIDHLQFQEAIARLEVLLAEFPAEEGVLDLWAVAHERQQIHERAQAVEKVRSEAQTLRESGDFPGAIRLLEQALESFPEEAGLQSALDEAVAASASYERTRAIARVLEEAQWFMTQGRPDLAVQLLREASAANPEEAGLAGRLALAEQTLADWEKRRTIEESLARAAALEQKEQSRTALTVLQAALQANPDATPLAEAAERLQTRIRDSERQRKLSRRLDLIRQKMAEQAWTPALSLIEAAREEFPGELQLEQLLSQTRARQRRAEYESIVTTIEQCLADGELNQAEEIVRRAIESYPGKARLRSLYEEVHREKAYQDLWREAEVSFGRGQFRNSERILLALAAQRPDDPNVHRLLETVRSEHAETEEKQFCDRGRAKVQELMENQQFDEAVDLLRNLLSLFPSTILDRDLQAALTARDRKRQAAASLASQEAPEGTPVPNDVVPAVTAIPQPPPATPEPSYAARAGFDLPVPPWRRPMLLTMMLSVLVASAAVPLWISSRRQQSIAAASPEPARVEPEVRQPAASGASSPSARQSPSPASRKANAGKTEKSAAAAPARRGFLDALNAWRTSASRGSDALVPAPPPSGIDAGALGVPAGTPGPIVQPAAVAPPTAAVVEDPGPTSPQRVRVGGEFHEPQLISGPNVVVPPIAKDRKIYGTVKLEATIGKEGTVTNVVLWSGHPVLVESAKQAILGRRYRPATLNGDPVEVKIPIQVVFDPGR